MPSAEVASREAAGTRPGWVPSAGSPVGKSRALAERPLCVPSPQGSEATTSPLGARGRWALVLSGCPLKRGFAEHGLAGQTRRSCRRAPWERETRSEWTQAGERMGESGKEMKAENKGRNRKRKGGKGLRNEEPGRRQPRRGEKARGWPRAGNGRHDATR